VNEENFASNTYQYRMHQCKVVMQVTCVVLLHLLVTPIIIQLGIV
jgi:hypothetical protein